MLTREQVREIKIFSKKVQMEICKMIAPLPAGHLGGSLSIADTISVLYNAHMKYDPKNPKWDGRDWLVMSKGHCGPAIYATLALKGFFPMEMLQTMNRPKTDLPSHCDRLHTPGIDMSTGSLGQGASTAAGVALAKKLDKRTETVYLIMGDGEIQEGQVWEMAMFAATRKLDNLVAFVDYNKLQIDGPTNTDDICNVGDIEAKFKAFGWHTQTVNGHDIQAIDRAINNAVVYKGKPSVIVLDTVKGHGWSKAENQISSHSRGFTPEELQDALKEMQTAIDRIKAEV